MRFHHVGYAVANIEAYLRDFLVPLFSPSSVSESIADSLQQVRVCFVEMQGGTVIELVEPLVERSPVHTYIGSRRGGLYHLCYEVEDLDAEVSRFRKKGCLPLSAPVPATAFGGRRIVFLMTPQHDLIELIDAYQ
ncbi:MAG: VOC family protein [Betaproteobacteria bacterium]|nr:VOC family protein [Betaproteobacteria bacterium]